MSTFVLVHGGWHGAWCWIKMVPLLEGHGHQVIAPDLPGHGADPTPLSAKPYENYVPKICALLDDLGDLAILVGHSSGGMLITEACRRSSEHIKGLVYLSAFLLASSKTPREVMKMDSESLFPGCLEIDTSAGVSTVKKECARSLFYGDCDEQDTDWAISRLQPEPLIPPGLAPADAEVEQPVRRIPRFYIECLQDRALGPRMQRLMYTESPCDAVFSLPTSHSPFLSAPAALTQHLLDIDQRVSRNHEGY